MTTGTKSQHTSKARTTGVAQAVSKISLDDWQDFVERHDGSTIFHHRRWLELLTNHYGFPLQILAVRDGAQIRAALPLLETKTLRGTRTLSSLPFSDYVPVLHDGADALRNLLEGIHSQPLGRYRDVVVRCELPDTDLPNSVSWYRQVIPLPGNVDDLRATYPSTLVRNLRKARRKQLEFTAETSPAACEDFYRLHVLTRRKLGVPVQTKGFFRSFQRFIIDNNLGFIGLVRRGTEPVSAGVFLTHKRTLMYKYAASNPDALVDRPNEVLIDGALEYATERSFTTFDFGVSFWNATGLRRFKAKWGAQEHPVPYTYFQGQPQTPGDESLVRRLVAELIRRSPTVVCRAVGAALYRYSQ